LPYPATQPPKGAFPQPPARGLPPRRACARQPDHAAGQSTATHSHCSSRLGSLHRDSVKVTRQSRRQIQSHARRADATGTRSCSASPRALSLVSSEATGDLPFSLSRRDCTYTVQGLLARASLRSTLSRYGLISLGFSKKYSGVAWAVSGGSKAIKGKQANYCLEARNPSTTSSTFCLSWRGNLETEAKIFHARPLTLSCGCGSVSPSSSSAETSKIVAN